MLSYREAQRFHVHVDVDADISGHREIPPLGFSYDKFLKAYGCELMKGQFPYEYMDDGRKLDEPSLPPKETFHSRLKEENISDEVYVRCQKKWRDNGMTTMDDFLVRYNNRDAAQFLEAIDTQFASFQQRHVDMLKNEISIPGL